MSKIENKLDVIDEKIEQLKVDMAIVRTGLENHLQHHSGIKTEFQWRAGLIIGVITFLITTSINLVMKLF